MPSASVEAIVQAAVDLWGKLVVLTPEERWELEDVLGVAVFPLERALAIVQRYVAAPR